MASKGLIMLALAALLVGAMVAQPADASAFTVYSGPGCTGSALVLNACGCSNIPQGLKGGYKFEYGGQTAAAYNSVGCTGVAHFHFRSSVPNGCTGFGWSSFFIQC